MFIYYALNVTHLMSRSDRAKARERNPPIKILLL